MEVSLEENEKEFDSFIINLKMKSKEDCIRLFNIMNTSSIIESYNFIDEGRDIRAAIAKGYPDVMKEYQSLLDKSITNLKKNIK